MHFKKLIILYLFLPITSFSQLILLADLTQLRNANFNEAQNFFESRKFILEYKIFSTDSTEEISSFRSTDKIFQRVTLVYNCLDQKSPTLKLSCERHHFYLLKEEIVAKGLKDISSSIKLLPDKDVYTKKLYAYQDKTSILELVIYGAPPEKDMFAVTVCNIQDYKRIAN